MKSAVKTGNCAQVEDVDELESVTPGDVMGDGACLSAVRGNQIFFFPFFTHTMLFPGPSPITKPTLVQGLPTMVFASAVTAVLKTKAVIDTMEPTINAVRGNLWMNI